MTRAEYRAMMERRRRLSQYDPAVLTAVRDVLDSDEDGNKKAAAPVTGRPQPLMGMAADGPRRRNTIVSQLP